MAEKLTTRREREEMVLRRWLRRANAANEAYYVAWLSSWSNRLRCVYATRLEPAGRAALQQEPRHDRD